MQDFFEFIGENFVFWRYLLPAVIVCVAFWVAGVLVAKKIGPALAGRIDTEKHPHLEILVDGFRRPLGLFLQVLGVCAALLIISNFQPVNPPAAFTAFLGGLPAFVYKALRIAAICAVTWGLVASSDIMGLLLRKARSNLDLQMSHSVTRFLGAIFKVVVIAIAAVILLNEMKFDINGLIAGLGLGGLTIALAAKDAAANFFGGLVLVAEKPFEIGDWVTWEGIEGSVEDISLRSTKIRTGPGSLTYVPNASLAASPITNWSGGMDRRRADFTLAFTYSATRHQLSEFTGGVITLLETDPEVETGSILVRFSEFGESGLNIRIMFYTTLPGFADHMRIRERINYALLDLAEKSGVKFAFPTRSLYVENDEATKKKTGEPEIHTLRKEEESHEKM